MTHANTTENRVLLAVSILMFGSLSAIVSPSTPVSPSHNFAMSNALTEWSRAFGGLNDDVAYSVIETDDGGYALAGYTSSYGAGDHDFWLTKTDSTGNLIWNKTYGGLDWDLARSMVQTADGGYALAGYTYSEANEYDFWLVKTNSTGDMQWNYSYGGKDNDYAYSVIQTSDGGYALAGFTNSSQRQLADFLLVKTDSNGYLQWSQTYGETNNDIAYSLVQTSDGGYALAGSTHGSGNGDFWLVRTDSSGNMFWSKMYGGSGLDVAYSVIHISDDGLGLVGYTDSQGSCGYDFYFVRADSAGNINWTRTYGGTAWDVAYSSTRTSDEGYALAGYTASYGSGAQDFWIIKTSKNGNAQWNMTLGGAMSEIVNCVVQTSDEGYVLAGYTRSSGAGGSDFWLVKIVSPIQGDINCDGKVDVYDLFGLGKAYGSDSSSPNWSSTADVNDDGKVDSADLSILTQHYGETMP